MIKNDTDSKCRFYDKFKETLDRLVSGQPIITPYQYLLRYYTMGQYIHWKIFQHYNAPYAKNWYKHKPQKVPETEKATILWNFPIHTHRAIQVNKLDITV